MACPGHAVLGRVIPKTLRTTNLQSITTKCKQRLSLGRSLGRPCPRRHALGMLSLAGSVPAPCEWRTYTRKHNPNIFMQWGWELSQQWSSGEFSNQKGQKGSTGRLGLKFRPSWIMTVPQRLCFSAQLSNCNRATCCLIELSILGLLHLSIRIRTKITFSCCMKFFQLKMTLGLALGWFKTRM